MKRALSFAILFLVTALAPHAQSTGIIGNWKTPLGSVIHFDKCGQQLCGWISFLSPTATSTKDIYNPDSSLRGRALCGLKIGTGFKLDSSTSATGGLLYDPKTGRTYHSKMTANGDKLLVHGYYGVALLSGSETWTHADAPADPCPMGN